MNRRTFFKKAALGAAVVAVAPAVLSEPFMPAATIGEYYNYVNFSDQAIATSMDELIEQSAVQLGYRAGQSISALYEATFDGKACA